MNRLNLDEAVNLGGHKMSLNDLNTLQLSTLDVAQALAYLIGQGGNNVILSKLDIDDRTNDFDLELPAMVYYNNKVYRVDAAFAQAKTAGGAYKFRIDTAVDGDNPVDYEDGSQYNVHIEETMTLVHTNQSGSEYVPLSSFESFNGWTEVTPELSGNFTVGGGVNKLRYKVLGRLMFIEAVLSGTLDSQGIITIQLPYTYHFTEAMSFLCYGTNQGPTDTNILKVSTIADSQVISIGNYDGTNSSQLDAGAFSVNISFFAEIKYSA